MAAKKPALVKVFFHRRGRDPESAWCFPLTQPHQLRLDNILFLHATPVYGDVIEARPSRAFDGALAFKRIVKPGGRYPMIVDYPKPAQRKKLGALLRERFDIVSEGCYGPSGDEPGRVYLAVPKRFAPTTVFAAARALIPGLIAVHPEIREKKTKKKVAAELNPAPKRKTGVKAKPAAKPARSWLDAIRANDAKALARIGRKDLAFRDEHGRSLLFMAILEGRTELVKRLIALGADVNPKGPKDRAPLLAAALRNRPREAKMLLAAGSRPELAHDKDGDPVLVTAAFREAAGVVQALLSVPQWPEHKSLALLEAAGTGNLPLVKLLVKHGADPHWKSRQGNSPVSIAKQKRRREIVAYFASLTS